MEITLSTGPTGREQIRIRGKATTVPAVQIARRSVITTGTWIKLARIKDEELVEGDILSEPATFISSLRESSLGADLFTFPEKPPQTTPRYDYHVEQDNWAVVPIVSFSEWWENRLPQESRKNARRAAKRGVIVKTVPFDDELVIGIQRIYNETPVRQGKPFWHYGKAFDTVKQENGTYIERSQFVGAFFHDELIGFVKIIYVDHIAMLIQILAMNGHHDKRPMNALLAHTVEVCANRGASLLVYGNYNYGKKKNSSLAEFKRRNGFEKISFPRYFVPLSIKGKLAILSGFHLGVKNIVPTSVLELLLTSRSLIYRALARGSISCANSKE